MKPKSPLLCVNRDEQLFDEWFDRTHPLWGSRAQRAQRKHKRAMAYAGWRAARAIPEPGTQPNTLTSFTIKPLTPEDLVKLGDDFGIKTELKHA